MDDDIDFPPPMRDETDALPEQPGDERPRQTKRPLHPSSAAGGQYPRLATRPDSDNYNMNHAQMGTAIIFNHSKFSKSSGFGERRGSDKDAENLYMLLTEMGFSTVVRNDLTKKDMLGTIEKVARDDHSNSDCFMCAILSHGNEGSVYAYDDWVEIEQLVAPMKGNRCKTLAGKPKIFFIQACRGNELDDGVDMEVADAIGEGPEEMEVEYSVIRRIPAEADFLMAYSCVSKFYAWRNMEEGSWFIQALCEVLQKNWKRMDLLSMMTRVCRKVAIEFQSSAGREDMSGKKQVPCITSMLTRDVYFSPKK